MLRLVRGLLGLGLGEVSSHSPHTPQAHASPCPNWVSIKGRGLWFQGWVGPQ